MGAHVVLEKAESEVVRAWVLLRVGRPCRSDLGYGMWVRVVDERDVRVGGVDYMRFGGVCIPDNLFWVANSGKLVVFAGAGASAPAPVGLPLFNNLVEMIKNDVDPGGFLRDRRCKLDRENNETIFTETPEQYLSYLEHEGKDVKRACSTMVDSKERFTGLHSGILRVLDASGHIRLVTTNFDKCFENATGALGCKASVFVSPALPLGGDIDGIVHLHGVFDDSRSMILTAEDYGRAYVSNGWASRFLVDLFKAYTVLFVGYSCGDSLVDYLTRSISSSISGRSFVLCKKEDADDWRMRGVEPIVFDDYKALPKVFDDWSSNLESSVTDRTLRIREICQADDVNSADKEFIIQALRWPIEEDRYLFTSEFCKMASNVEFIRLLKDNGFLDFFSSRQMNNQNLLFLEWLISEFSVNEAAELQNLCADYLNEIAPTFFECLFRKLAASDVPESIIASWLPWLEFSDWASQKCCEYWLIEIARKVQSNSIALAAIRILLKVGIAFHRSSIAGAAIEPTIVVSRDFYGEELIEIVKARSSAFGSELFEYCFNQIERAYDIQTKCWAEADAFDGMSFGRSSIAPHEQDRFCDAVEGVLIDVARECISRANCLEAMNRCLGSRCALLYRLGLWVKCEYASSGDDLEFIAANDLLSNVYARHEVFCLMKTSFALASNEGRRKFVDHVASRVVVGDQDSEYSCYNICVWLKDEMSSCFELASLYNEVKQRNPQFAPREHPEFTHYSSCWTVDNSEECRLPIELFNNKHILGLLQLPSAPGSFVTKYDRVSIPTSDHPLIALKNLRELLDKSCSKEEIELANLYIKSLKWGHLEISVVELVHLIKLIVADERTCITGVGAIGDLIFDNSDSMRLTGESLVSIAEEVLPNFSLLLSSKSSVIKGDNSDWALMGINHPAGKYIELLAKADMAFFKDHGRHCQRVANCLDSICEQLSEQSDAAGCVIACIFQNINVLYELNRDCFNNKLLHALQPDNWAFSSAWEGMSYSGELSLEAWNATRSFWPNLFKDYCRIGKNQFEQLIRLYVRILIVRADPEERGLLLVSGVSASKDAMSSACMQLGNWMETLEKDERLEEWDGWLAGSLGKLAGAVEGAPDVLAERYSRWIREYPEMRGRLLSAILRDCEKTQNRDLFIFDGVFSSIAQDEGLRHEEKVALITFLLENQRYLHFESDARRAIRLLEQEGESGAGMQRLRDAATRKGMIDALLDR